MLEINKQCSTQRGHLCTSLWVTLCPFAHGYSEKMSACFLQKHPCPTPLWKIQKDGWSVESLNVEDSKLGYFGPPGALFRIMHWISVSDLATFWLSVWRTTVHLGGEGVVATSWDVWSHCIRLGGRMQAGRENLNVCSHDKIPAVSLYHLKVTKAAPPAGDQIF